MLRPPLQKYYYFKSKIRKQFNEKKIENIDKFKKLNLKVISIFRFLKYTYSKE